MVDSSRDEARAAWSSAETFTELCELAARFLEGEVAFFPGWVAPYVDEETDALVPSLAALCRAGFLTCASQPGHGPRAGHDGQDWCRRAFVAGFAARPVAARLTRELEARGLLLRSFEATESTDAAAAIPVGLRGETPFLFAGGAAGPAELEIFGEVLARPAREALADTSYVSAIDPEWDERTLLWEALRACTSTFPGGDGPNEEALTDRRP